jgi:glyoxylase-like metal-dependent hydrolase (beta-lactamase superfamily II)
MKEIADGVWQLSGFPPNAINVYLAGDVLIDASTRHHAGSILKQLKGRDVSAHALTHAHADHQGSSHEICETLGIPLWCGEADVPAMEDGDIAARQPKATINTIMSKLMSGPGHPVARALEEGDEVAGFAVLDAPGHSLGHVAYWREADRVLILGDVLNGMNLVTTIPGLREPPKVFTPDPARNRESARRLGELEPAVVGFGHGPVYRDAAKFAAFCRALPA